MHNLKLGGFLQSFIWERFLLKEFGDDFSWGRFLQETTSPDTSNRPLPLWRHSCKQISISLHYGIEGGGGKSVAMLLLINVA